ncbi:MAG: T9SS type A sorting domain-containing protein [Saprospiraceae bacterium]|nr:T9SS type A sorting domain-containing protein [Candidatus Brachybacter algidus]
MIYNTKSIQTNQQNSYSYIDLLNYYANYYRLKIIDEGGAITYSNIVRLLKEEDRQVIDFFPNPTNGYIKMRHNYDNKNALVMINVLDIFGKSVYKGALTDGSSFELKSPDGMYILEATGPDGFVKIDKIVKISR